MARKLISAGSLRKRWARRSVPKVEPRGADEPSAPEWTPERALQRARRLEVDGDPLAAIDLLRTVNREQRDPRVEARLVDLQVAAYGALDWPTQSPAWPADVEDLFPGAVIPEIGPSELSSGAVRSALRWHGSLIVRGLLGPEQVRVMVDDTDSVLSAYDHQAETGHPIDGAPWFVPFKHWPPQEKKVIERVFRRSAGGVLAVDAPRALFDMIEVFDAAGIGELVRDYFGEAPAILARKWTLRRVPHDAQPSDWHQDGAFMGRDIRSLNIWVALSECGVDAPGIDIVGRPLQEIVATGTHGAKLSWTVSPDLVEQVAEGSIVRPCFQPGDVLIFDHMNLHRTAVIEGMTRDRYALEAWFFAPSTYGAMTSNDPELPASQIPIVYSTAR